VGVDFNSTMTLTQVDCKATGNFREFGFLEIPTRILGKFRGIANLGIFPRILYPGDSLNYRFQLHQTYQQIEMHRDMDEYRTVH